MLHEQRVSAFPVIDDDNKVIGVVSETDLLAKEALEGTAPRTMLQSLTTQRMRSRVNAVTAADLMTRPAVTIGADEPVIRAARLMFDQRVKRLPVTSDCDPDRFTVAVRNGIVTIEGTPETSRAGHDVIDAARHMEGVVFVRDRLSYPDDSPYLPRVGT